MAVSIIQSPAEISFSRNPNFWGFKTDNLYSNAGTYSTYVISFPAGPLVPTGLLNDDDKFSIEYNGKLQSFTVENAPDDSGLEIRSGAGMTLLDWCNRFIEDLTGNFLLSRDYLIELDLTGVDPRVRLTAKVADPIYDISVTGDLVNSVQLVNGIKKAKHEHFGIWFQLLVGNDDNTAFEIVQTDTFLDVNDDGECFPNLSTTLTEALIGVLNDYEQPDPAMPAVQRNRKSCRRYYIRYAEAYGSQQSIKKIADTVVKWVMLGGTGKADQANYSIPDNFFVGGFHHFLKQDSSTPLRVTLAQCEWLSMVWLTGPIAEIRLHVKTYFTEGDPVEHTAYTTADVLKYDKITYPAGATQLNLPVLYPAKVIAYYEVWLTDALDAPVSEIRTYQLNYEYQPYAKWFSYLSSLGCYDTLVTVGAGSTEYDVITQRATITKTNTFVFEEGETFEFGTSLDIKENVLSGWIRTKRELKRYRDFFLSWNKFQVKAGRAYPVMLNSKSIKEYKDADHLFYVEFETGYRFTEDSWTEDDEDAAPGVPVDVSQFWPAVSVPDPVDFDHLYYRKTQTYNQAEIDDFIANALAIEAGHHATQSGQIDALTAALVGKSNFDHLHPGVYVPVGEFNDFVVAVGAALIYKGPWDATYTIAPDDPEVLPGYFIGNEVALAGTFWRSLIDENTSVPGTDPAKWERVIDPKTKIAVANSVPFTIAWQTEMIPGKTYTYAQKHGNDSFSFDGLIIDGATEASYKPNVVVTRTGDLITSVEFKDVFQGQIIIS